MKKVADILQTQGVQHALVVHSDDGLDEISISSNTKVIEIKDEAIQEYYLNPEDFGIQKTDMSEIKGGSSTDNAIIIHDILSGSIKDLS